MNIEVRNLSKAYRDADRELAVIKGLSFNFPSGKQIAIVGRSGVGKSTLLQLLGGLDRPSSGGVWFGSTEISALQGDALSDFRARYVGFIFQFHHLLPEFSALDNVAMPLIILGESDSSARRAAQELLQEVGLAERISHRPAQLSGGEQQRVAVARALITHPAVVLADEPTGNLDQSSAAEVQRLLCTSCAEQGSTLIVVTHNRDLAAAMHLQLEMLSGGGLSELKI